MLGAIDLSPGAIFAKQFRVIRPLGQGGMGAVYVVEQIGTARERALKLMHPTMVSDERSRERFEREARIGSRIESDHVVEVIAAGIDAGSGTPWICMELLRGETLDARMARGPLAPADALEMMRQLGHALAAAHRVGIVHRDLKPENIFLATPRREGIEFTLKVLDFGIATLAQELTGPKTTQGVGSPMWMAPEQTDSGRVTQAADVWAMGLLAFHLLSGKMYWRTPQTPGSTLTALLVEIMVEPLVPASVRAAELGATQGLPPAFDAFFSRCVVRDPAARYQDAASVTEALSRVLEGRSLPPPPEPVVTAAAFEATMASTGPLLAPQQPVSQRDVATDQMPRVAPESVAPPKHRGGLGRGILIGVGGASLVGLLLCGGIGYAIVNAIGSAPDLLVEHDGDRVTISSAGADVEGGGTHVRLGEDGLRVDLPDGGTLVMMPVGAQPAADDNAPDDTAVEAPAAAGTEEEVVSEEAPEASSPPREHAAAPRRRRRPRLSHEEQRFVAAVVRACAEGNPHAPDTELDISIELAQFGNPRVLRARGGGDEAAHMRSCIHVRGYEFRFDPATADPIMHFTTVVE